MRYHKVCVWCSMDVYSPTHSPDVFAQTVLPPSSPLSLRFLTILMAPVGTWVPESHLAGLVAVRGCATAVLGLVGVTLAPQDAELAEEEGEWWLVVIECKSLNIVCVCVCVG